MFTMGLKDFSRFARLLYGDAGSNIAFVPTCFEMSDDIDTHSTLLL